MRFSSAFICVYLRFPVFVLAAVLLDLSAVNAQPYPSRPVRLIVPVAPAGAADITARLIALKLTEAWGEPVIVDNRGGAAGNAGAEIAARSAPDGYTLVLPSTSFPSNASLYRKLPFDTARDFEPIVLAVTAPNVLVVNPALPAKSVKELIALAKAQPGRLNFASSGHGSSAHLSAELFKKMAGVDMVSVNFKGGGPALIAVIAGEVQLQFPTIAAANAHVRAGRLRALGVTTAQRLAELPELPTVAESGLPGFDVVPWFGLFAPAGTPAPIVARVNRDVQAVLLLPEARQALVAQGLFPAAGTPRQLGAFLRGDIAKWAKVIQDAGIRRE
jgi:tripartite-type tricarboxylate transporter receptor subunit TctC